MVEDEVVEKAMVVFGDDLRKYLEAYKQTQKKDEIKTHLCKVDSTHPLCRDALGLARAIRASIEREWRGEAPSSGK